MKKVLKLMSFLAVFAFVIGVTSCSNDKEEPSASVGTLKITNNSRYTLTQFQVNFMNDDHEIITREPKGTLKPNGVVTVDIPIGATKYYMGTYLNGTIYWSANYQTSIRKQVLTDDIVGLWTSN